MENNIVQNISLLRRLSKNWVIKNYNEVLKDVSGGNKKIQTNKFLNKGEFPIIDQGRELISGFNNDRSFLVKSPPPYIIFGDHTRILKYVDFNFSMGADGIKVIKLIDDVNNDYKYLYYFLQTLNIPNTGYNRHYKYLKGIKIPLPDLATQRRIAARLDKADEVRRYNQQLIEKYDELTQSLFLDMFGDPVKNEKGWKKSFLNDVCTDIVDCPHSTPKKVNYVTDFPCIRTSEIKNSQIEWKNMQYLDQKEYEIRIKRLKPKGNDIVYAREGSYGDAVLLPEKYSFSLGQRTMLFRANENLVNPFFLHRMIVSDFVYSQAKRKNTGSTVGHVNVKDIKLFTIYIPPISLQNQFAERVQAIEAQKQLAQEALAKSEELFQSLLKESFS